MDPVKILYLGDIVGSSGRQVIAKRLPEIRDEHEPDLVIANGENAAHGFGLTLSIARDIIDSGVDVITGGNHTWDKREVVQAIETFPERILRPANYPPGTPGVGAAVIRTRTEIEIGVINLMGRVFMDPLDCPFQTFEREIEKVRARTRLILVDLHAEASSEKQAMGYFVDGRVSALVGSHTHVQTADERILPKGTGYLTDAGMNGPLDSIIGMKKEIIIERFLKKLPLKMEVSDAPGRLHGVLFVLDRKTGKCVDIERIQRDL